MSLVAPVSRRPLVRGHTHQPWPARSSPPVRANRASVGRRVLACALWLFALGLFTGIALERMMARVEAPAPARAIAR